MTTLALHQKQMRNILRQNQHMTGVSTESYSWGNEDDEPTDIDDVYEDEDTSVIDYDDADDEVGEVDEDVVDDFKEVVGSDTDEDQIEELETVVAENDEAVANLESLINELRSGDYNEYTIAPSLCSMNIGLETHLHRLPVDQRGLQASIEAAEEKKAGLMTKGKAAVTALIRRIIDWCIKVSIKLKGMLKVYDGQVALAKRRWAKIQPLLNEKVDAEKASNNKTIKSSNIQVTGEKVGDVTLSNANVGDVVGEVVKTHIRSLGQARGTFIMAMLHRDGFYTKQLTQFIKVSGGDGKILAKAIEERLAWLDNAAKGSTTANRPTGEIVDLSHADYKADDSKVFGDISDVYRDPKGLVLALRDFKNTQKLSLDEGKLKSYNKRLANLQQALSKKDLFDDVAGSASDVQKELKVLFGNARIIIGFAAQVGSAIGTLLKLRKLGDNMAVQLSKAGKTDSLDDKDSNVATGEGDDIGVAWGN